MSSGWRLISFNEWGIAGLYVVSDDNRDFPVAKICDQYRRLPAASDDVLVNIVQDDVSTMANARLIALAPKLRDRLEAVREGLSRLSKSSPRLEMYNKIEEQVSKITETLKELDVVEVSDEE